MAGTQPDTAVPVRQPLDEPGNRKRLVEVDALRGLAALAVVLIHYLDRFDELHDHATEPLFWVPWGARGVQVFFVISGFVIFMTLSHCRRPMDFIVSRFSRLYPAYWAGIIFTTLAVHAVGVEYYQRPLLDVIVNFTMLQKLPFVPGDDIEGVYWTLYVELWFYAAIFLLYILGQLRRIEVWLVVGLIASTIWWGGETYGGAFFWGWQLTQGLSPVMDQIPFFVMGVCLYRIYSRERPADAGLIIVAALLTVSMQLPVEFLMAGLIALGAFGLILTGRAGFLRQPVLLWMGAISYTLYLVHNFAGRALIYRLEDEGWTANAAVAMAMAIALLSATLLTWLVERPAQRAIRRWYARSSWSEGSSAQPSRSKVA